MADITKQFQHIRHASLSYMYRLHNFVRMQTLSEYEVCAVSFVLFVIVVAKGDEFSLIRGLNSNVAIFM